MNEYLILAKKIAYEAGKIIKQNFEQGVSYKKKKDNSEITKADIAINKLVIKRIKKEYPLHGVLGEEESFNINNTEYIWVCDPIDGTLPFIQGIPTAVFSLALTKNGIPIIGVIYEPILNKLYYAQKGKGAFLNNKKIHVSNSTNLAKSVIEFTWTKDFKKFDVTNKLITLYQSIGVITNHHAIIYAGSIIAEGKLDGLIFVKHTAHDGASVKIIVEEAGGKVSNLQGNNQRYDTDIIGMVASNGRIHDQLINMTKDIKVL